MVVYFDVATTACMFTIDMVFSCHYQEGVGTQGSRGARVVWVSHDHIVVSGFSK